MRTKTIVLSANTSWYIYNFRKSLIKKLLSSGYLVSTAAPLDDFTIKLKTIGCTYSPITLDNQGTNPFREIKTIVDYRKIYSKLNADIILHFTSKPNIFGTLAARSLGIPCINNIAGLGTVFIRKGFLQTIVKHLYKFSQSHTSKVFFQNSEDMELFIKSGLVETAKVDLLPGSGVDINKFSPVEKVDTGSITFLLIARLLWDKGVGEFAEAAKKVKEVFPDAEFQLLGFSDKGNPNSISEEQLHQWENEGILKWLGRTEDVRPYIAQSDCVVLPSFYREGTPRSLLEAASMGKPIITSDAVGCRDVVDDGINGLLCKAKNSENLKCKMIQMIQMPPHYRAEMGRRGREKMVSQYDEKIVIDKYLESIRQIIESRH